MAKLQLLERRLALAEERLAELESSQSGTLHKLRRDSTEIRLDLGKILEHLTITPSTEKDVDAVLKDDS